MNITIAYRGSEIRFSGYLTGNDELELILRTEEIEEKVLEHLKEMNDENPYCKAESINLERVA